MPQQNSLFCAIALPSIDSLIVATGTDPPTTAMTLAEWGAELKSVEDATTNPHKMLYAFDAPSAAATTGKARHGSRSFIVGAWPQGLNSPGACGIARETLRHDFAKN